MNKIDVVSTCNIHNYFFAVQPGKVEVDRDVFEPGPAGGARGG